ncbi:MAG: PD-(D/E)XK nuclease family protein [Flavobacteriales bacterium]|nr:PD-(D/E)XK nuclease family protein [Flavobacteriales bacterium]
MNSFIQDLADHIIEKHEGRFAQLAVVLPGKRSGQFLIRAIKERSGHIGWLPQIITLSELFERMSGKTRLDSMDLVFELFLVWRKHFNTGEKFIDFLQWGSTVLADFNEVDHHLLDAQQVYRNLKAYKDLDDWSFGEDEELWSKEQKDFANFWGKLLPLYEAFAAHQEKEGRFQGGKVARAVAKDPITPLAALGIDHVIFAGLNALTPAEQAVIKRLEQTDRATVVFDADDYFVRKERLEAGHFIREMDFLGNAQSLPSKMLQRLQNIHLVSCSTTIAQMQYVHGALEKLDPIKALNTAVVLPDNSVLPPLLHAVPENYDGINVTMGKSLSHTPYKSLLHAFFRIFDMRGPKIRHQAFTNLLLHPYLGGGQTPASKIFRSIHQQMVRHNRVFVGLEDLATWNSGKPADHAGVTGVLIDLYAAVKTRTPQDLVQSLKTLLKVVRPVLKEDEARSEAFQRWRILNDLLQRLDRLMQRYPVIEDVRELERITMKLFSRLQVDLIGEPLTGLQIMGLLESRALDFERVFILNANEGILPKQQMHESFLPAEIRAGYGLPNSHERDAIFAYYFYRLLQRASEVHVLYNGHGSDHKVGEKSRYVQQLETSETIAQSEIKVHQHQLMAAAPKGAPQVAPITASEWTEERWQALLDKGLSPSAINKWTQCTADFFYRYILGLREQDEVEESMEANTLGTLVHEILERGYEHLKGRVIHASDIEALKPRLDTLLDEAIEKHYSRELTASGLNYLSKSVVRRYVRKLIDNEIASLKDNQIEIKDLEGDLTQSLSPGVTIFGKADRIDRFNGTLRVVDYKSGKVTQPELSLRGQWQEQLMKGDKGKALQTMIYAWLAFNKYGENAMAGILSSRSHSSGFLSVVNNKKELIMDQSLADSMEDWLSDLIVQMGLDVTPAVHNEKAKYCEYCLVMEG